MKQIEYEGGVVSFSLPNDWNEGVDDEGNGVFYRDTDDSGTLRLTLTTPEIYSADNSIPALNAEQGLHVEEGFPLKEEIKYSNENGYNFLIYMWHIYPSTLNKKQNVTFSYTILSSQENDPLIERELGIVRNAILNAHYLSEN